MQIDKIIIGTADGKTCEIKFDPRIASHRRFQFNLEKSHAHAHQTTDRFIFDSPAFQPSKLNF